MSDRVTKEVEGNLIVRSATLVCPSPETCDVQKGEAFEAYVERHAYEHGIDLAYSQNAERNLGLWCGYFDHKYNWGNPSLTPFPHWELHSFITDSNWNAAALELDKPVAERTFMIPAADKRGTTEYRRFKQIEVPRQSQKTSTGARWYPVFRAKHEYFVNDRSNYRVIIRSNTKKNVADTLRVIRRMSSNSRRIVDLYGVWSAKCPACQRISTSAKRFSVCQWKDCKHALKRPSRRIGLVNESKGAGAYGTDMISFRWLTDAPDADAVAAYSIWVAGLGSSTTGQRPDLYIWDDPQTEENSDTVEKRADIAEKFDESVRQLEIPGELLVLDTRKYVDDFAGGIHREPLRSLFWSLHRRVRWQTDEPDNPPYVVGGYRYYYPVKGTGEPALNAAEVDRLESQMRERRFSAEYLNDPVDPSKVLFKREYFRIIDPKDAPPEIRFGLGRDVTHSEQQELDMLGVQIHAINGCDPASKEESSRRGDDTFIVGLRTAPRLQAIYLTYLAAGKWAPSRKWAEIERANAYNRPEFTDYELPNDEGDVKDSFAKWCRERAESVNEGSEKPKGLNIPMWWSHMPKSGKPSRIEHSEVFLRSGGFFILSNAGPPELIEKYIGQWVGHGVTDHDDGPDITSRLFARLKADTWNARAESPEEPQVKTDGEVASVPVSLINEMAVDSVPAGALWGDTGW